MTVNILTSLQSGIFSLIVFPLLMSLYTVNWFYSSYWSIDILLFWIIITIIIIWIINLRFHLQTDDNSKIQYLFEFHIFPESLNSEAFFSVLY